MRGQTTIAIAPRLSTLKDAGVIYNMGGGLVLEVGHTTISRWQTGLCSSCAGSEATRSGWRQRRHSDSSMTEKWRKSLMKKSLSIARTPCNRWPVKFKIGRERMHRRLSLGMISLLSIYSEASCLLSATNGQTISSVRFPLTVSVSQQIWVLWLTICLVAGIVYAALGLVLANSIQGLSQLEASNRHFRGDRNALWWGLSVKCLFFGHLRPVS